MFKAHPSLAARRRVNHVDAVGSRYDLTVTNGVRDIHVAIYTTLDKLHVVFRQRSRLVSEDVLHLGEKEA